MTKADTSILHQWILGRIAVVKSFLTLEEMGFEIEASHHEVAPGQHEIDFKYADAIKAADQIQTFKLVVKTVARQHGLHASFMPKPFSVLTAQVCTVTSRCSRQCECILR